MRPVSDVLRFERTGPAGVVARVTLTRPDVHNAFNATVIAELRSTFAGLARETPAELRAVILAGDGPSFCAGADIAWMRAAMALDVEGNEQDAMAMADMFEALDTCPVPVIARVQGAALGGGMGLCAVSDVVIAESGARFGFTETRLGILPAVIAPFVIAKIGESQARALFPADVGSMPFGRSGSGSSTRSSRARPRSTRRSMPPLRTSSPPGRRRPGRRRRWCARFAALVTVRRSGTRHA